MRGALKISAWTLSGLLLFASLLIGALYVAGNSASGRLAIERIVYRVTSDQVKLSGLGGAFPSHLTLDRLEISDARGVWLTADHIVLNWSPFDLLRRYIRADSLKVARLSIDRAPVTKDQGGKVSIPHIGVRQFSIDVVALGPELVGTAASLTLSGSGELHSLEDATADVVARRIGGDGEYVVRFRFDASRMDGTLTAREPAGGPLENLLQFPGLGALSASMTLSGPHRAERVDLKVDAGDLHGWVHGDVNLVERSADLGYSLEAPAMQPRPDLAWQRLALSGRWQGNLSTPAADGQLEVEKLRIAGDTQVSTLNATLGSQAGLLTVNAVADGLVIPGPRPQLLRQDSLKFEASLRLNEASHPLDLSATHRLFSLRAHAVTVGEQSVSLDARLTDLAALASIAGQDARGNASVKAQLSGKPSDAHLILNADINFTGGTAPWIGIVGNRVALQLTGGLTGAAINVERLQVTGRALNASLSGSASRPPPGAVGANAVPAVRARWDANLTDLGTLSSLLAGRLNASGSLSGTWAALAGDAQFASTFSVRGSTSGTLAGVVHAHGLTSAPDATLQAQGSVDGAPLALDSALERGAGGAFRVLVHRADWKSVHADGDVSIGVEKASTHGQLRLTIGQLGDLDRLLGSNIQGSIDATADFKQASDSAHGQFRVDAHDLIVGKIAGNAQLTGEGQLNALNLKVAAQLPKLQGSPASLSAAAQFNLDAELVHLSSAVFDYRGQQLRLLKPAQISLAGGVTITQLEIGAQAAVFQLDGRVSPTLDLSASLHHLEPALVNAFEPDLLAEGSIEASAHLQGSPDAPTGRISFDAAGIRLGDNTITGLPLLEMRVTAELMGDSATIDGSLRAGTTSVLTVSGTAPLNDAGTSNLKMVGKLDVGLLNPLLEARGQRATGDLAIDATLAGTMSDPQIGGTINLSQGSLRDYGRGASLSDITAQIVGTEGRLQINSFKATAAPGTVSITGTIGVLQPGLPVDLKLIAKNARPIASTLVTANLDADLHISGMWRERIDVAGSVRLNRTDIGIPNTLPPSVAVLDVRRRGQKAAVTADKQRVIGLDVAVHAPQQIIVQGRGIDAELGGDLQISGTIDVPLVSGGFDLQRGNFTIAGNRLNFSDGHVSFNGVGLQNKIDPTLDFTAKAYVTDTTVTLRITGLADAPRFDFSSDTGLPQDDIMARLLFGVSSASQLSALQLAQIGAALATLSGVGGNGSLNPLVKLQKGLGLDRLTVVSNQVTTPTGTTSQGTSIEAGRYISKRVYVEAKQSSTGASQVQVDVDLTKHLKLQTRLGDGSAITQGTTPENDPGSSIGLSYQFEY
jgi:translocation and assembly module TamB